MLPVRIKDSNAIFGEPDEWENSQTKVDPLFARRENRGGVEVVLSAWKPSDLELRMLKEGGTVVLGVVGSEQPPVFLEVSTHD